MAKRKVNRFKILGNTAIMYLDRRDSEPFEALVDTEDILKIIGFGHKFSAAYRETIDGYYPQATVYMGMDENGRSKGTTVHLNYFLMGCPKGMKVDHINHNTLDNRKENLRIINNQENCKHREGVNINSTSGYRNVSFINKHYRVQLQIDGKNHLFKEKFDDPKEAGEFAKKMREIHYGKFAGN